MKFAELLDRHSENKTAIIAEDKKYTYSDLKRLCNKTEAPRSGLWIINENSLLSQLICFLSAGNCVPVISARRFESPGGQIPSSADFAVQSSGSTGMPKLLYRTAESWYDFFEIQNGIFSVDRNTVLFMHGSLAFSGNLNMLLAALYAGATTVISQGLLTHMKIKQMEKYGVNTIYMIPDKLRALARLCCAQKPAVKTVIAGSQSMCGADAVRLQSSLRCQNVILYYGAAETSYISYMDILSENKEPNCVGKTFPTVRARADNGRLRVSSPYMAIGCDSPFTLQDIIHTDGDGYLYYDGRWDDVLNIGGEKLSSSALENKIKNVKHVTDACVFSAELGEKHEVLCCAYCTDTQGTTAEQIIKEGGLSVVPKRWYKLGSLAKNANGKTDRGAVKRSVVNNMK